MVTFELSGEVKKIFAPLTLVLMQNVLAADTELQSTTVMEQHTGFLQLSPFTGSIFRMSKSFPPSHMPAFLLELLPSAAIILWNRLLV